MFYLSTKTETSFTEIQASQLRNDTNFIDVRRHQIDDRKILEGFDTTITEINVSQQSTTQELQEVKTNIETGFAGLRDSSQAVEPILKTTGSKLEAHINSRFEEFQSFLNGTGISLSDSSIRRLVCPPLDFTTPVLLTLLI